MPSRRKVSSLQNSCLKTVASLVVRVAPSNKSNIHNYKQDLHGISKLLATSVPCYLHDALAEEVLEIIKARVENEELLEIIKTRVENKEEPSASSTKILEIAVLSTVVASLHLKSVDFSKWPRSVNNILFKNFQKIFTLENVVIDNVDDFIVRGTVNNEWQMYLINNVSKMKNLKRLSLGSYCTDLIIKGIAKNCPCLEFLDITLAIFVTDRSIPFLLKCQNLREFIILNSNISVSGCAQLITGLSKLENIGYYHGLESVVEHLHKCSKGYACLTKINGTWHSTENLILLASVFPKLQDIELNNVGTRNDYDSNIDLTNLYSLNDLDSLSLSNYSIRKYDLNQFLQIRGSNIVKLGLEYVDLAFSLNDVVVSIGRYCPKLKILNLAGFFDAENFVPRSLKLTTHPFLNLEILEWNVKKAASCFEFILTYAFNIRSVTVWRNFEICTAIYNALQINPLKQLEELMVHEDCDLNMKLIESLLVSCENIKILGNASRWMKITEEELSSLNEYIRINNLEFVIRPGSPLFGG